MSYKTIIASIIVANYNNKKFLKKCINSILAQKFKQKEIIVVDDNSTDDSIKLLDKYKKKILLIKNKQKTSKGSFNQMNAYYNGFLKSKGKYIFFLDSDDYFKKEKIKTLIGEFKKTKQKIIFDLPILKFKKKIHKINFKQKNLTFSDWPRFTPQSCISLERNFAKEIFKELRIKKFSTIWLDFRIATYSYLKFKNIFILKKHLTYYRQVENSASKKYKTFSKNWWFRRNEAHKFVQYLKKKLNVKNKFSPDKTITNLINLFLK